MKKLILLLSMGIFLTVCCPAVYAEENTVPNASSDTTTAPTTAQANTEEQQIETAAQSVDQEAANTGGKSQIVQKLKDQYNVDDARIQNLRDKKMGYGEISIVLGLAKQMPDGINDENINKITQLRMGDHQMGWGNVAKELDLKLGRVRSDVERVKPVSPPTPQNANENRVQGQSPNSSPGKDKWQKSETQHQDLKPDINARVDRPEHGNQHDR